MTRRRRPYHASATDSDTEHAEQIISESDFTTRSIESFVADSLEDFKLSSVLPINAASNAIWNLIKPLIFFAIAIGAAFIVSIISTLCIGLLLEYLLLASRDTICIIPVSHTAAILAKIPALRIPDLCASPTQVNHEALKILHDLTGAQEIAEWKSYGQDIAAAKTAFSRTYGDIDSFITSIQEQGNSVPGKAAMKDLALKYKAEHEVSGSKLDDLLRQHDVLRALRSSMLTNIRALETKISQYEDRRLTNSKFWKQMYIWFPILFDRSPTGQLLNDLDEFAESHSVDVERLYKTAKKLQDCLNNENDARSKLQEQLSIQMSEWKSDCAAPKKALKLSRPTYCKDLALQHLKQSQRQNQKEWFSRAREIAEDTTKSYEQLLDRYTQTRTALKDRLKFRKWREVRMMQILQHLGQMQRAIEMSKKQLAEALVADEAQGVNA